MFRRLCLVCGGVASYWGTVGLISLFAAPASEVTPRKMVPMPLNHFVYIIQENITFDHYFGTFPVLTEFPRVQSSPTGQTKRPA
jgi:phospholipase C